MMDNNQAELDQWAKTWVIAVNKAHNRFAGFWLIGIPLLIVGFYLFQILFPAAANSGIFSVIAAVVFVAYVASFPIGYFLIKHVLKKRFLN